MAMSGVGTCDAACCEPVAQPERGRCGARRNTPTTAPKPNAKTATKQDKMLGRLDSVGELWACLFASDSSSTSWYLKLRLVKNGMLRGGLVCEMHCIENSAKLVYIKYRLKIQGIRVTHLITPHHAGPLAMAAHTPPPETHGGARLSVSGVYFSILANAS